MPDKIDTSESYGDEDLPKGMEIKITATQNGKVVDESVTVGTHEQPQPEAEDE